MRYHILNTCNFTLGCLTGIVIAVVVYALILDRPELGSVSRTVNTNLQDTEDANPSPIDTTLVAKSPSSVDYSLVTSTETDCWLDNGSFLLTYKLENGDVLEIVMVGPDDPDEDPPGDVLWSLNPKLSNDYIKMDQNEIFKFVSRRLKTQTNLTSEEAGYLSTLLVYSLKLVRLKRWGFGYGHFRAGEWYKVFERPERAMFGNSRDSNRSQPKE